MAQSVANIGRKGFTTEGSVNLEFEGVEQLKKRLDLIRSRDPHMERTITRIIRMVMATATKEVQEGARSAVPNDISQSYRAVRSLVYRRIYGGNINILTKKRARGAQPIPDSPTQSGRGGNRRKRSANTTRMMGYWGEDRGFVLRWINEGTNQRHIGTSNNSKLNKKIGRGTTSASVEGKRNGNRGRINAKHWFEGASMDALYNASARMTAMVDEAIMQVWGEGALGGLTGTTSHNRT